ncbi:MAG TPA: hypothetical protein VHG51_17370 [Longimicrobiaceae bacterium]|nr:hypothetical protein [Longimicrobiaceae bacterium]
MRARLLGLLAVLALLAAPAPLRAQAGGGEARLEGFIARVARLWEAEDAQALAALAPAGGRMVLEVGGEGAGPVQERHAAAALRSLFADRESVSVRPSRVTVAGGEPVQGFGEIAWISRSRGVSTPRSSIVYVGVVREGDGWRIRELRVLP